MEEFLPGFLFRGPCRIGGDGSDGLKVLAGWHRDSHVGGCEGVHDVVGKEENRRAMGGLMTLSGGLEARKGRNRIRKIGKMPKGRSL